MKVSQSAKILLVLLFLFISGSLILVFCGEDEDKDKDLISSRTYQGHENDTDSNNFVNVFRNTVGTRLDDCQTCHRGGNFQYESKGKLVDTFKNACDYCHLLIHPDDTLIEVDPIPVTYMDTLNSFGEDYYEAGQTKAALESIKTVDSDNDGFTNADEIADLKYPGDENSNPDNEIAPMLTYTLADLQALTAHEQFMLANSHKQEYDDYVIYKGVTIKNLLSDAGVDITDPNIVGITIIAPDGYMKDFTVQAITNAYPAGLYYAGLDKATLGTECGFVTYPDRTWPGLVDGGEVDGEQWLMLAYMRDNNELLDTSVLDITSGKINGEGPFRIIVPQSDPGSPDRGSQYSPTNCGDGYDYDDNKNHNAGDMVRGVVVIRVNPLPEGYEDFDYRYGGWAYVDSASVVIYGYGITGE